MTRERATRFGLIVVGNEVLDGRVQDRHRERCREILGSRHLALAWCLYLPDVLETIEAHVRWAYGTGEPFFCCGGIGATPDDLTREAAARAAGLPLERHPAGVRLLEERFGSDLTESRLRMVDFPRGATLVPNPVNRVPGFRVGAGCFLPGFPQMAHPMIEWVLDTAYEAGIPRFRCRIVAPGAREADLAAVMEAFVREWPGLSFSCLPSMAPGPAELRFGLEGERDEVERGAAWFCERLQEAGAAHVAGAVEAV